MTLNFNSPITFHIFPEPWENHLFGPIDQITVVVDGQGCTVSFTVATGDFNPDNGKPELFEHWIARIQGAALSRTGITEEERQLLKHFALGYRAFYLGCEDVPTDMYYEFIGELVADTLALCQPEPAGQVLETAVEWLLGHLSGDIFDHPGMDIPPVTQDTNTHEPAIAEALANAPSDFSPTGALIEICAFLVPARTAYSDHMPRASYSDEGRTLLRLPSHSVSTERAYMMLPVPPAPQTDSGYDTDDSIPSLRYVTDSSDKEDGE